MNLSHLPEDAIEAVRLVLAGKSVVYADGGVEVTRRWVTGTFRRSRAGPGAGVPWAARAAVPRRASPMR